MLRSMLAATLALGLAAAAGAQEARPAAPMTVSDAHHSRLERRCEEVDGLSLCVSPAGTEKTRARDDKPRGGRLTRFARLAGMFMGRVDAADLGPLKVRLNFELR